MEPILHVRYHSMSWELAVEAGYTTMHVNRNPCDETQTAVMIYTGVRK